MPIILPSGKNLDSLALQRCSAIFDFRLYGLRYHPARHPARPVPLRPLLLLDVYGWFDRGRLGDVGVKALVHRLLSSLYYFLPRQRFLGFRGCAA